MAKDYSFKINGVDIPSSSRYLTADAILELAKEKGAIPGDPKDYVLKGAKGDYSGEDQVDLAEDNLFLTVPNTPTPVAAVQIIT